MKYKCLILDHDDTVVNSTATIHFPSFVEFLRIVRPEKANAYTLEDYFVKNFHPGIVSLFRDEVGLTEEEFEQEQVFWGNYVSRHIPTAYPGIAELIAGFRARGGIVAVDSHSYTKYIIRDYEANGLPMPDVIYGWELPAERRKPRPDTVFELMEKYALHPSEVIVIDDLKPGYDMARAAGVNFAAAGWAHDAPEIESFMRKNADHYSKTVADLTRYLLENDR